MGSVGIGVRGEEGRQERCSEVRKCESGERERRGLGGPALEEERGVSCEGRGGGVRLEGRTFLVADAVAVGVGDEATEELHSRVGAAAPDGRGGGGRTPPLERKKHIHTRPNNRSTPLKRSGYPSPTVKSPPSNGHNPNCARVRIKPGPESPLNYSRKKHVTQTENCWGQ